MDRRSSLICGGMLVILAEFDGSMSVPKKSWLHKRDEYFLVGQLNTVPVLWPRSTCPYPLWRLHRGSTLDGEL